MTGKFLYVLIVEKILMKLLVYGKLYFQVGCVAKMKNVEQNYQMNPVNVKLKKQQKIKSPTPHSPDS